MVVPGSGEVATYCRVIYDQPNNKGTEWVGDYLYCLDYTTDPAAEDKQVRMWMEPKYKRNKKEEDDETD